jgi:hypothetical protein
MSLSVGLRRLASAAARGLATKTSTGIVGLPVVEDSVAVLAALSTKLLADVAGAAPPSARYRQAVEALYSARLAACNELKEPEAVEAALGQGQMEELIRMARDEEALIPRMAGAWPPRRRLLGAD